MFDYGILFTEGEAASVRPRPEEGLRERSLLMDKRLKKISINEVVGWEPTEEAFVARWRAEAGKNVSVIKKIGNPPFRPSFYKHQN